MLEAPVRRAARHFSLGIAGDQPQQAIVPVGTVPGEATSEGFDVGRGERPRQDSPRSDIDGLRGR